MDCMILLDMGVSKSFMSKTFHLNCPSLHSLPKFVFRTKNIFVGNGQYVGVLFLSLLCLMVHEHMLKVYTLVSEINDNLDIIMGIKKCMK